MIKLLNGATTIFYHLGLIVLFFSGGGLLYLVFNETPGPTPQSETVSGTAVRITLFAAVITVGTAIRLLFLNRRRLLMHTLSSFFLILMTLYSCELVARQFVPAWPTLGLHGVPPDMLNQSWGKTTPGSGSTGFNNWGQRDRTRSIQPATGTYRIAFIGDSYLEESSSKPISLHFEEKLLREDVEVINLGVSATSPDEYYYRTRNIALNLNVDHCVLFIYAGNDFSAPARSLESFSGVAAVYPRESLFSVLRLKAFNHLLTNDQRPLLQTWFSAGDLNASEEKFYQTLQNVDDTTIRQILLSSVLAGSVPYKTLSKKLSQPEIAEFYNMLRNPDNGLFRSYYLWPALQAASVGGSEWNAFEEDSAYHWITRTSELCSSKGVSFTLVIIPEGFQVDPRLCEQWEPLADMRRLTSPSRHAAKSLYERCRLDGIRVIDFHKILQGIPGTYLNLDGHWSDKGGRLVADELVKKFKKRPHNSSE